jgi:uncharacterized protein (TIGR00251 family)
MLGCIRSTEDKGRRRFAAARTGRTLPDTALAGVVAAQVRLRFSLPPPNGDNWAHMATAQIRVRLRPRAHRDELIGMRDGVLQARVTAAPVDGKANRALCKMIAKRVGVAPSRVSVVRGEKSREKLVRVDGVESAALQEVLDR